MSRSSQASDGPAATGGDPREREVDALVRDFLAGYDLESDIGRFRAFRDAIAHAQEHLLDHPYCNLFLDRVGRSVGREPAYLDHLKARTPLPESARLDLCYEDDWGFVVTGNRPGLLWFSDLLRQLAEAPCSLDHVHLPNDERPLGARSYSATLYKEADDWFEKLEDGDDEDGEFDALPRRDLEAGQIYALQFVQFPPPELPLTVNRIYRVRQVAAAASDGPTPVSPEAEDAGHKPFEAGGDSRRFRFEFVGDTRRILSLVLHLDDPGVNFFTKKELVRVVLDPSS